MAPEAGRTLPVRSGGPVLEIRDLKVDLMTVRGIVRRVPGNRVALNVQRR